MKTVFLYDAWRWTCPHCGKVNLAIGDDVTDPRRIAELDAEEIDADGESWNPNAVSDANGWYEYPSVVVCEKCLTRCNTAEIE